MPGYLPAFAASGNAGSTFVDLRTPSLVSGAITDLKDWMLTHGWSEDGGPLSTATITVRGIPSHSTPSNANYIGGTLVDVPPAGTPTFTYASWPYYTDYFCIFQNLKYKFWNPASTDPSPAGTFEGGHLVVAVSIGSTMNDTLNNFAAELAIATSGAWEAINFTVANSANHYESTFTLRATSPGTSTNITFAQANDGSTMNFTPVFSRASAPMGGGYYLFSTPVVRRAIPLVQDQIRLSLFQGAQENLNTKVQFNGNSAWESTYPAIYGHQKYLVIANPYQFAIQHSPYNPPFHVGDAKNLESMITAALYVPDDFKLRDILITDVTNTSGIKIVITTDTAHFLNPGARIVISGVSGGPAGINAKFFVKAVETPTTFTVSRIRYGAQEVGDGAMPYSGGGVVSTGIEHACVMAHHFEARPYPESDLHAASSAMVQCNGDFKRGPWTQGVGISLPMINSATPNQRLQSTTRKTIIQPPMVHGSVADGAEGRILGCFWDSFIELERKTRFDGAYYQGHSMILWNRDETNYGPNRPIDYSWWMAVS